MEEIKFILPIISTVVVGIIGAYVRSIIDSNNKNVEEIKTLRTDYSIAKQQIEYLRKEMDAITNKFENLRDKVLKCKSCNL